MRQSGGWGEIIFCLEKADVKERGKWSQRGGEMNVGQVEGKHAEGHAYDGLMLFCMN